ncbi:MAG: hypothetical protein M3M88_00580 [Thermoproteota archaeon]|nr:hypothetical protein [Thermoproteota archaeon]
MQHRKDRLFLLVHSEFLLWVRRGEGRYILLNDLQGTKLIIIFNLLFDKSGIRESATNQRWA